MSRARQSSVTRTAARLWWLPLVPVGFFADRGCRRRWLAMPGVVILTALTSSLGKLMFRRPRPGSSYRVVPWGRLAAAGFPSTHSACAFAVAGWLRTSRRRHWLHTLAVLIGISRVRCRAHHATDVAAGAILGYGIALQADRAYARLRARRTPPAQSTSRSAVSRSPAHSLRRRPNNSSIPRRRLVTVRRSTPSAAAVDEMLRSAAK